MISYELGEEAEAILTILSSKFSIKKEFLLSEAIGLLEMVCDAKLNNKKVVLTDNDLNPESELKLSFEND